MVSTVPSQREFEPVSQPGPAWAILGHSVRSLHVLPVSELLGTDNGWMEVTVTLGMQRLFSLI